MAEVNLDSKLSEKLKSFMSNGTIRVFECGEDRPDHIQDRPFFGLLPEGETSFIQAGQNGEECTISVGEPPKDYILDTENHRFFQQVEERFRNVRPGMTLFVIDPDVVMGRYAADHSPERSVGRTLYMHIVEKLQQANVYQKTPIDQSYVPDVFDAAIASSNAFSATNPVNVTKKNLDGDSNISLVVGDNPDTLVDDMFHWVPGVKERMEKEGVTRRQLQQFTIYHEFGHALDPAHKGGFASQYTANNVDAQLARHRTECLADAHAVLQLARDYGQTDISLLIGDVRIETMNNLVKKYMEKQPTTRIEQAIDKKANENLKVKRSDDKNVASVKTLESQADRFKEIDKVGRYLAYYTTGVVDAAIDVANKKLADGSLMKMTDLEVLDLADKLSQEHGLTKEEMTKLRIDMVDKNPNPIVEQIKQRTEEAFDRMPISRKEIDKMYAQRAKKAAKKHAAEVEGALGIVKPQEEPKLTNAQLMKMVEKMEAVAEWRANVYDKIITRGTDKDALISVITEEKESVRKASIKDPIGQEKMDTLNNEFIADAPTVMARAKANQTVFKQLQATPAKKDLATDENAVTEYFAYEMSSLDRMGACLKNIESRDMSAMNVDEQLKALHKDRTEFTKVLTAERMAQMTAMNICRNETVFMEALSCPALASGIAQKADQKHPEWMSDYQMVFGACDPHSAQFLRETVEERKFELIADVASNPKLLQKVCEQKPTLVKKALEFAEDYMARLNTRQAMEEKAPKMDLKQIKGVRAMQNRR